MVPQLEHIFRCAVMSPVLASGTQNKALQLPLVVERTENWLHVTDVEVVITYNQALQCSHPNTKNIPKKTRIAGQAGFAQIECETNIILASGSCQHMSLQSPKLWDETIP